MLQHLKNAIKHAAIARLLKTEQRRRAELPSAFNGLPPELWGCGVNDQGHLAIGNVDLTALANTHGTPLHVVDHAQLVATSRKFTAAFHNRYAPIQLATSYKTNPLPGVVSALHEAGTWAEVISDFELWLALRLGVAPEHIILNGPGKGPHAIRVAAESGVRLINLDGPEEIDWAAAAAASAGRRQDVGLRVVTSVGWSAQFGVSIRSGEALEAFRQMARYPMLNPCALHLHLGTGISDVDLYVRAIREVLEFGRAVETELGLRMDFYDLGGGFGVPTVRHWDDWDGRMAALGYGERSANPLAHPSVADYAEAIARLVTEFYPTERKHMPMLVFEPGRAITSGAQTLLLKVLKIKRSRGVPDRVVLDGGKNITMPLAWEFHQIFAASRMSEPAGPAVALYGPLCHPGDVVATSRRLPPVDPGDIIAVMDAGAYFIPNQMNFSNPRPGVVMVRDGAASIIRAPEGYADIVRLDRLSADEPANQ